jgi:hypothetical protein
LINGHKEEGGKMRIRIKDVLGFLNLINTPKVGL